MAPEPPAFNGAAPLPAEETLNLREVGRTLRRHARIIAATALVTTGIAVYLAYRQVPRYLSTATIRMADNRRAITGGLEGEAAERINRGGVDPILSEIEVLRSRSLLGRVVDGSGLRLRLEVDGKPVGALAEASSTPEQPATSVPMRFTRGGVEATVNGRRLAAAYGQPIDLGTMRFTVPKHPGVETATLVVRPRERVVAALVGGLRTKPRERTNLVDVSYMASVPQDAQRVLQSLVVHFQAHDAQQAQQTSRRRRLFLEEQLSETQAVAASAQVALSNFRRTQQAYSSRERFSAEQEGLMNLEVRREELEAERQLNQSLLTQLERGNGDARALRALVSSPAVAANPLVGQLYEQLARFETIRDSLTSGPWRSAASNPDLERVNQQITNTQRRVVEAVRSQVAALDARITALDALRARRESRIETLPDVEAEEVRLTQEVATTQAVADQLRSELQRARISEAVEAGGIEIVDPASYPAAPVPTRRPVQILLGLLVGLGLGGGLAFVLDQLNTSIRTREDLDEITRSPSLAVIPEIISASGRKRLRAGKSDPQKAGTGLDERLVAVHNPQSPGAEAYRTLRTNLIFSRALHRMRTLVVTSAGPAEGKTTTSINLAATFAQQGMRVLLVDCDLRRPRVHDSFAVQREPGLTQLLFRYNTLDEVLHDTPVPNLNVIASGTLPPNPAELLGGQQMGEVIAQLRERFDLVLLDTPPVLLAPDSSILGASSDGVLLVVRAGVTERAAVQQSVQQLQGVGANLLGAVLNDPENKLPGYSGYQAYAYYGQDERK
jgi:tyrosine-protein kinase Etk/Wzc